MARREQRAAEVARLYATGLNGVEIARELGLSRSYVYALLTDPDGSVERERKRRYDLVCVDCGGRVLGTTPGRMANRDEPRCHACATRERTIWTDEAIVFAIQQWADQHGGIPPTASDVYRERDRARLPAIETVRRRFQTWNAAIIAAGFEPHANGPVGGITPLTADQREECAQRYAAGETSTRIAYDLGCSYQVVLTWARAAGVPIRSRSGRSVA